MAIPSTPNCEDWSSLATAQDFIKEMTEADAYNVLWAMRQQFGWYTEVFDREDVEAMWDEQLYGRLTDEIFAYIARTANDWSERVALEAFSDLVRRVGAECAAKRGRS